MPSKKAFLILTFCLLLVATSGCISIKSGGNTAAKGYLGVFQSQDSGASWKSRGSILNTQGKVITLGNLTINKIEIDPNDSNAVYLATNNGLYFSYDAGESWQQAKYFVAKGITSVSGVAVDYQNKCTIFVAASNKIFKSTDCSRTFTEVYVDTTREGLVITNILTENYNNNVVYAANNKGDILKSDNYGVHWKLLKSVKDSNIKQVLVDKNDTRIVYFLTEKKGLYKTTDGGATWSDDLEVIVNNKKVKDPMNKAIAAFKDGLLGKYLAQDMTAKDTLILASKFGLLQTSDGGSTWKEIPLVTPDRGANIYSLAIDPKNSNNIYYGTDTTLYKSVDGGNTWQTQKAPTIGYINYLLINPNDPKIIYLGGKEIPKE
jgi:photosystem II stability/assembly factor-like uncharacterized protein